MNIPEKVRISGVDYPIIARKNHKLTEWREFCEWIETLPLSELITGDEN